MPLPVPKRKSRESGEPGWGGKSVERGRQVEGNKGTQVVGNKGKEVEGNKRTQAEGNKRTQVEGNKGKEVGLRMERSARGGRLVERALKERN